jgi:hypothetical protein
MNAPPPGQACLVIVGATGMVGGYALRYALDHPAVGAVTAIGRRKLDIPHPKLKEVLHQDFADCSALADALSGQDAAVFCLGAYTGVVPDMELRKVTVDYTIAFARVLCAASPAAAFSFLSGSGADPTGRSRLAFARYKGEAENLPAWLYLSGGAAQRTEFQLPFVARNLPGVSGAVPQSGDPGRRFGPRHGGCCRPQNRRAGRPSF